LRGSDAIKHPEMPLTNLISNRSFCLAISRLFSDYVMSIALAVTWKDRLTDLGNVPAARIRSEPTPGTATVGDVLRVRNKERRLYELVDGTLVEKAMGWQESFLAGLLLHWLNTFLDLHRLGVATGPDYMTRLFGHTLRFPDLAFVAWERMPGGRFPTEPMPDLVPNFVIEVLSESNTYGEMSRKRREYFHAGVELLWIVDHRSRAVTVFTTHHGGTVVTEGQTLDGGNVLPGWKVDIADLFNRRPYSDWQRQQPSVPLTQKTLAKPNIRTGNTSIPTKEIVTKLSV
jgi:Uma2 family endonuclease